MSPNDGWTNHAFIKCGNFRNCIVCQMQRKQKKILPFLILKDICPCLITWMTCSHSHLDMKPAPRTFCIKQVQLNPSDFEEEKKRKMETLCWRMKLKSKYHSDKEWLVHCAPSIGIDASPPGAACVTTSKHPVHTTEATWEMTYLLGFLPSFSPGITSKRNIRGHIYQFVLCQ